MSASPDTPPVHVLIKTSKGDIRLKLDPSKAPLSVANFLNYANSGFYKGTTFHRVIKGFMIQGGGMDKQGQQKATAAPIKNEATNGLLNKRGTIAMARTNVVDSATSQFFINLVDNDFLNYQGPSSYGYAVFGEVESGLDVVDAIGGVKTDSGDQPLEPVEIQSVEVLKE